MAFPRKLLHADEDIALDLHPHWWSFAGPLAALIGSILLGIVVLVVEDVHEVLKGAVGILVLGCLIWFGARYAVWATTSFVVTTDRLIYRHGVVTKKGIEIPLERVNTVFFSQNLFERVMRFGDLIIESASEQGRQNFSNVRKPSAVQNEIYHQIEDNENRKFDRIGAARAAGPAGGDTIPAQIRELDELRRQGVLSDDEFARKKQQLLDRM